MGVGTSNRTLGKHILLDRILGREVGALSFGELPFIKKQYTFIDLCAGDGEPSVQSQYSSPKIIMKYLKILKRRKIHSTAWLVEKNQESYDILKATYKKYVINMNALDFDFIPRCPPNNSACFIHSDPNAITDWPITRGLLDSAPEYTTLLATLGCNVNGLKRLPLSSRLKWFEKIDEVISWMPYRHDAMLAVLNGDNARWAYLIIGPKVWHDKGKYITDIKKAFSYWELGVSTIRYKTDIKKFEEMKNYLFLTQKEVACQ